MKLASVKSCHRTEKLSIDDVLLDMQYSDCIQTICDEAIALAEAYEMYDLIIDCVNQTGGVSKSLELMFGENFSSSYSMEEEAKTEQAAAGEGFWEKVKAFFSNIWQWIKNLFSSNEKIAGQLDELIKKLNGSEVKADTFPITTKRPKYLQKQIDEAVKKEAPAEGEGGEAPAPVKEAEDFTMNNKDDAIKELTFVKDALTRMKSVGEGVKAMESEYKEKEGKDPGFIKKMSMYMKSWGTKQFVMSATRAYASRLLKQLTAAIGGEKPAEGEQPKGEEQKPAEGNQPAEGNKPEEGKPAEGNAAPQEEEKKEEQGKPAEPEKKEEPAKPEEGKQEEQLKAEEKKKDPEVEAKRKDVGVLLGKVETSVQKRIKLVDGKIAKKIAVFKPADDDVDVPNGLNKPSTLKKPEDVLKTLLECKKRVNSFMNELTDPKRTPSKADIEKIDSILVTIDQYSKYISDMVGSKSGDDKGKPEEGNKPAEGNKPNTPEEGKKGEEPKKEEAPAAKKDEVNYDDDESAAASMKDDIEAGKKAQEEKAVQSKEQGKQKLETVLKDVSRAHTKCADTIKSLETGMSKFGFSESDPLIGNAAGRSFPVPKVMGGGTFAPKTVGDLMSKLKEVSQKIQSISSGAANDFNSLKKAEDITKYFSMFKQNWDDGVRKLNNQLYTLAMTVISAYKQNPKKKSDTPAEEPKEEKKGFFRKAADKIKGVFTKKPKTTADGDYSFEGFSVEELVAYNKALAEVIQYGEYSMEDITDGIGPNSYSNERLSDSDFWR